MDALEPGAGPLAQLGIEVGERLVQQQDAWPIDDRAGDGDALLLAAGELERIAVRERSELEPLQHLACAPVALGRVTRRIFSA